MQTFQEVTAQPGEAVRLECSAVGTPVPNISWDLDGMVITENERMQVTHRFGTNGNVASTMVIQNAKVEDGGVYTCTVANPEGKSQSSARVNIFGAYYPVLRLL